jgi:hypothetical protein
MTRSALLSAAVFLVVAALLAAGCVQQRRFRFVPAKTNCFSLANTESEESVAPPDQRPSLDCRRAQYKMAFIEFDEQGRLFERAQAEAALKLLEFEKARAKNGKVITVVYVHGWKNNAAEATPGGKQKDVEKFQSALLELGYRAEQSARASKTPAVPMVGIYIGWRGKTLMGPGWFTFASLWSRRNTANNIGDGPDLAVVLNNIIDVTNKGNENSRVLLIGHSFGARVLEHAIESQRVKLYDEVTDDRVVRPRVDLALYVNSANDSRLSMGRVQQLQKAGLRVRHPDFDPAVCNATPDPQKPIDPEVRAARCRDYPLIVAIMSKGDKATKYLLPVANTINGDRLSPALADALPALPATDSFADQLPSAGKVRKVSAGHFGFLQSHVAREVRCPAAALPRQQERTSTAEAALNEAVRRAIAEALGKKEEEAARKKREAADAERRRVDEEARLERALHPVCSAKDESCRFVFRTLGDKPACYQVDKRQAVDKKPPFNETPYWIMNVEPSVIKDHGDIWNVSFVEMLGQLMAPRGFFDTSSARVQLLAK